MRRTRRLTLLIGTLTTAMVVAVLPAVAASAATPDYADGYAVCEPTSMTVHGARADQLDYVIQVGRYEHPGICAAEQKAIDSLIQLRGVPNTVVQRDRIIEFGRGLVAAEIYSELVDISHSVALGYSLQPWQKDAYAWYQQQIADAKLAAVKQAQTEYQDWGNDPCHYKPPSPYTYDPYTGGTCSVDGMTDLNGIFTGGPNPPTYQEFLKYGATRYFNSTNLGNVTTNFMSDLGLIGGIAGSGAILGLTVTGAINITGLASLIFPIVGSTPTLGVLAIGPGIAIALIVAGIARGVQVFSANSIGTKLNDAETAAQKLADDPSTITVWKTMLDSGASTYDAQLALGAYSAALAMDRTLSASVVDAATPDPVASTPWFKITDGTTTKFTQKISFASVTPTDSSKRANYEAWLDHNWWVVQEVQPAGGRMLMPTLPVYVTDITKADVGYVPGSGFAEGVASDTATTYATGTKFTFKAPPVGTDPSKVDLSKVTDVTASLYDRPYVTGLSTSSTSPAEGGTFTVSGTYHDPAGLTGYVTLTAGSSKSFFNLSLRDGDKFSESVSLPDAGKVKAVLTPTRNDGRTGVETTYQLDVSDPAPTDLGVTFVNTANDGYGPEPGKPVEADLTFNDVSVDTTHTYTVEWGDGAKSNGTFDAANPPQHTYATAGIYLPTVSIKDDEGATASTIGSVTVKDVLVLSDLTTSSTSPAEGGTFTVNGTFHDASGSTGSVTLAVPGASKSATDLSDGDTFSLAVTLPDAGSIEATLSSSDDDARKGVVTTYPLNVSDPAPTDLALAVVNTANDGYGPEPGKPVEANLTFHDVSVDTTHTYTVKWGDGAKSVGIFDAANPPQHTYAANGDYAVTMSITDDEGATASTSKDITVNDVPVLTGLSASATTIDEGQSVTFTGTVVDESPGDPSVMYSWTDPEGNSSVVVAKSGDQAHFTLTHLFGEEGTFTETFTPIDSAGLAGKPVTVTVHVNPVPPTLTSTSLTNTDGTAIGAAGVLVGRPVELSWAFSEPGSDPDVLEVNWGDGTTDSTGPTAGRIGSFNHTWASDGTKNVVVTVTDDDGSTATKTIPVTVSSPADVAATVEGQLAALQGNVDPTTASQIQDVIDLLDNGGNGDFVGAIDSSRPKQAATKLRDAIVDLTVLADQGVPVQPEIATLLDLFGFYASTVVDQAQADGTASPAQISAARSYLAQAAAAVVSGDAARAAYLYRDAVSEVSRT